MTLNITILFVIHCSCRGRKYIIVLNALASGNQAVPSAIELKNEYPFILPAVQAHIDRLPKNGNPGRPVRTLIEIMHELQTEEFGPVFREFCRRESIYGFGDLQVKQLFDDIVNNGR